MIMRLLLWLEERTTGKFVIAEAHEGHGNALIVEHSNALAVEGWLNKYEMLV